MDDVEAANQQALGRLRDAYQASGARVAQQIKQVRRNYTRSYGYAQGSEKQLAKWLGQPVSRAEYLKLLAQAGAIAPEMRMVGETGMRYQKLLAKAASGAYAYRINRLEALKMNVGMEAVRLGREVAGVTEGRLRQTFRGAFMGATFDQQQRTGYGYAFALPDRQALAQMLREPWHGGNYSSRLWKDTAKLAQSLEDILTPGMLAGRSQERLAAELAGRMGVSYREAMRLVRTECTYISNQADLMAYREAGITRYRFLYRGALPHMH